MPSLPSLERLKIQLNKTVAERVEELNFPTPVEVGMKIPGTDSHVLVREDGVVEMAGGPGTGVRVDRGNSSVNLSGKSVTLSATDTYINGEIFLNYQRFDPLNWWMADNPALSLNNVWNGPLVLNNQSGIAGLNGAPPFNFVAGVPQAGQYNTNLAELMHPQPLLGPNEIFIILASSIGNLLTSLGE